MSKKVANLLLTASALLSLTSKSKKSRPSKSNKKGSRNCPSCHEDHNDDMDDLETLVTEGGYHLNKSMVNDVFNFGEMPKEGSANTSSDQINKIRNTISNLNFHGFTSVVKDDFLTMFTKIPSLHPELSEAFYSLCRSMKSYEFLLLYNMGFTNEKGNYLFAKNMLTMVDSLGARSFINRYLQRTAIIVPSELLNEPLFKAKESWLIEWVCKRSFDKLDSVISAVQAELEEVYGLGLYIPRLLFVFNQKTKKPTKEKLTHTQSLHSLSEVAWFLEVAKRCGVHTGNDLLYTYPVENMFTDKRFKEEIGDTVFSKVRYKLHIPSGAVGYPETSAGFPKKSHKNDSDVKEVKNLSQPFLYFYEKSNEKDPVVIVYYSFTSGSGSVARSPVFTHTEKMGAISFSIPAGMPQYGGSCISASYEATGPNKNNTVCRECYALKGNYLFAQYVFSAAPRMNWLVDTLKKDNFGETLAYYMALSIEAYARYGYHQKRGKLEFGYIKNKSLIYPTSSTGTNIFPPVDMRVGGTSQDWIDFNQEGAVAGFFRIHDSGDFTISSDKNINNRYINSWGMVASTFSEVKFWAPTRNWTLGYGGVDESIIVNDKILQVSFAQITEGLGKEVFDQLGLGEVVKESKQIWFEYVDSLNAVCEMNSNLIIRPSGLTVINPFNRGYIKVPMIQTLMKDESFLAAGTGVNAVFTKSKAKKTNRDFVFTEGGFNGIAFNTAYPAGVKGRLDIKEKIGAFLKSYFERQYGFLPAMSYTKPLADDGSEVWQCPVNLKTTPEGKPVVSADNCLGSNCRVCWLKPKKPVTYGAH